MALLQAENTLRCRGRRSVRYGYWFTKSKMTMVEVLLLTSDIIRKVPSSMIETDYSLQSEARSNWYKLRRDMIVWHVEFMSEKIGGEGKVIEIDKSKFGKRKYGRGYNVRGQWVLGGVERGRGKTFLVPVAERSADTLVTIIKNWNEPGTIISYSWAAYRTLSDEGYEHQTVNHSISFVNEKTGAHTNTIECTGGRLKLHFPLIIARWTTSTSCRSMVRKNCISKNCDPFSKFMNIVSATDWGAFHDV